MASIAESVRRPKLGGRTGWVSVVTGLLFFVVIRVAQRDARKVHPLMYVSAGAFVFYFLIPLLHDNLSWV